jgi:hypothetical protein
VRGAVSAPATSDGSPTPSAWLTQCPLVFTSAAAGPENLKKKNNKSDFTPAARKQQPLMTNVGAGADCSPNKRDNITIVCLSRMSYRKGIDLLV